MRAQLERYGDLIRRWNPTTNLVSKRDVDVLEARHFDDSLSLVPHLKGTALCDVGSGAGLPGIPLAIEREDLSVTLVERSAGKARFLRQVVIELGLSNVTVIECDVRRYRPPTLFDTVTARALVAPQQTYRLVRHLLTSSGVLLLQSVQDLSGLEFEGAKIPRSVRTQVPGLDRSSWITEVSQCGS